MAEVTNIFLKLKEVFHLKNSEKVVTTNFLFRLYVKLTSIILFIFSILVFTQQLFDNHIKCLQPSEEDVRSSAINKYCFIMGTYTVPSLYGSKVAAHVGVGQFVPGQSDQSNKSKHHHYFQWVPYILFIQAMIFHLPNLIWKSLENSKIDNSLKDGEDLDIKSRRELFPHSSEVDKALKNIGIRFAHNIGYNSTISTGFIFCEFLNFLILVVSFFLTDWFLAGDFHNFGIEWINYMQIKHEIIPTTNSASLPQDQISPMDKIFPKVTKCSFQKFGPSGGIIKYDILCVLSLNVLNEKIFLILWFWFASLLVFSCIGFLYRSILVLIPASRNYLVLQRSVGLKDRNDLKELLNHLDYSDWFVLKRISDNVDRFTFGNLTRAIKIANITKNSVGLTSIEDNYERIIEDCSIATRKRTKGNNEYHRVDQDEIHQTYKSFADIDEVINPHHKMFPSSQVEENNFYKPFKANDDTMQKETSEMIELDEVKVHNNKMYDTLRRR